MKTALVTGITGQDGSYLAELLLARGYRVAGLVRSTSAERTWRIASVVKRLTLVPVDLDSYPAVRQAVADLAPDECYHLAGHSFVSFAAEDEFATLQTNLRGTHHLLSALREARPSCRFFLAASSEVFGNAVETPQRETTPFAPRSIYGISKVASMHLARHYREAHGLFASCGILFNHESPRRGEEFVTRKIALAAARIKLGQAESLALGNLDAQRDWGHAQDFVEAMWRMLQRDRPEDYVLATGVTHSVRDFVDAAFGHLGLDYRNHVTVDPRFVRPADSVVLRGDAARAQRELDWRPTHTFEQLVKEMVQADLEALGAGKASR